jgi:UDP-N-acetylglucosamine--N-acetylmuramyl-(pentapeptide) pyrophosphoryl-undecaprenol N-acetylglucosamine transferase
MESTRSSSRPSDLQTSRRTDTVLIAGGGTGGHLIPALVIAEAIQKGFPDWRVILCGAERGLEARLLPEREFAYYLLPAEPIYRRQWWRNLRWPVLAVRLMREVSRLLDTLAPRVVIGTGGYASGPVVWAAARRGIPTAMLELNAHPGLAVRWLAPRVREVWLGSPEARSQLRPGRATRIVDTGTPIAPPDPSLRERALRSFGLDRGRRVMLVSGGSQGSLALNQVVAQWVEAGGADGFQLLWVTGRATYSDFRRQHRPPGVQIFDFLDPLQPAYSVADLALTRAGMMTIAELSAWGVPSILVPLPTAAADHQTANALAMKAAGASVFLSQMELTPDLLHRTVSGLLGNPSRLAAMREAALRRARADALATILDRFGILSG